MTKFNLSRRAFIRQSAIAALGLLAGCATPATQESKMSTEPVPEATSTLTSMPRPTQTSVSTATPVPPTMTPILPTPTMTPLHSGEGGSATSVPTATPVPLAVAPSRDALLAHYPQTVQSVISTVYHPNVWDGDQIVREYVLEMLDAAITQWTGLGDALGAWQVLFDPGEIIGIKVNTISRYTTNPVVAYAVAQRLQDAGIPAEQIVIFDRTEKELIYQGYTINVDGEGVRCQGAQSWDQPLDVAGSTQRLHDVILRCDALINLPVIKEHGISGMTSALKNHYGTINSPGKLHSNACDPYIPALNDLPVIRDKTRLVICDALRTCPYDWDHAVQEHVLMLGSDSVANDILARQVLLDRRDADGRSAGYIRDLSHYLDTAVDMGLGADEAHIEERRAEVS